MLWLASDMNFAGELSHTDLGQKISMPAIRNDQLRLAQVEQLTFARHIRKVEEFLNKREIMRKADSRPEPMLRLILSEIDECLVEFQTILSENNLPSKLKVKIESAITILRSLPMDIEERYISEPFINFFLEIYDQLFLILGFASSNRLDMDFDKVYARINGQGGRSDVFDRLQLLAGGLLDSNPVSALEEFLVVWGSMATHQELQVDSAVIMQMVLDKNELNYPERYFKAFQYIVSPEGKLLKVALHEDEFGVAFNHRVQCLRLVRRALKLSKLDRTTGMLPTDHLKYETLILNHQDSNSFKFLAIDLVSSLGKNGRQFTYNQLMAVEAEPHRVVPGLKPSEWMIKPGNRDEVVILQ